MWASWCLAGLVLVAAGVEGVSLWHFQQGHPAPPRWDMAGHGWQGVQLLQDLEACHPFRFLAHLNAQDKWPFGFSLLLLPFLAAGDATFASARLLPLVAWVAVAPLLVLVARRVVPGPAGLVGGALAAMLWLGSPLPRVLALVILRETVALAILLLALFLYLRAREKELSPAASDSRLGAWRASGVATLALVLVKYNYALIWILAVLLDEGLRMSAAERRRLGRWIRDRLTPWGGKPWRHKLLAVALDLVLLAGLIGVNPGIPIWLGLVVTAVVGTIRVLRGDFSPRTWLRSLPARRRAAVETVVLPIALWWLSPHPIHPRTVYGFLRAERGGEAWDGLFYVRSYLADHLPHPAWAVALGLLAAVAAVLARRWKGPWPFLTLLAWLGCGLISFHPYKVVRFGAPVLPLITLTGALAFGRGLLGERPGRIRLVAGGLVGLLVIGASTVAGPLGAARERLDERLARDHALYAGDPRLSSVLEPMAEATGAGGRVGVVGVFDELSSDLVRWTLVLEHGVDAPAVDGYRKGFDPATPREEWWPKVERWLDEDPLDRVLVLQPSAESRWTQREDFRRHNAWQMAVAEALVEELPARSPALQFSGIGLAVHVVRVR